MGATRADLAGVVGVPLDVEPRHKQSAIPLNWSIAHSPLSMISPVP